MASEDSDEVGSGLAAIHGLHDLGEIRKTLSGPVQIARDHEHAALELLEVLALGRTERVPLEEGNDLSEQIPSIGHDVLRHVLAMVVVPAILLNPTDAAEEVPKVFEARSAANALRHHEPMTNLIAELVGASPWPAGLAHQIDREASFSVYKPQNPAELDQSFLLIVRTVRIVTAHDRSLGRVPDGYTGFPAYSRMHTALLPGRGAASLP
jgi:hypothetical protein